MSFKKLNPHIITNLSAHGITSYNAFQKAIIPRIKSGANIFGIAPKGAGKTTALILGVAERLRLQNAGDNPKALIFVKDKDAALELQAEFEKLMEDTGYRIYSVYEERIINLQKDEIYAGSDIVIATPKRLSKLYFLNGINLTELQMIIVADAEFMDVGDSHTLIDRISESMQKCQHLVFAESFSPKIKRLESLFMEVAEKVEVA